MTADPWAPPDTEAPQREREERNADLPDFFKMEDLVGRNVMIKPEKIEEVPDGKFGPYEKLTAEVVIVLDGRKDKLFPVLPRIQRNMWIYAPNVISEMRAFLNPDDKKRFGKAALVYVTLDTRKKVFLEDGTTDPEAAKKARDAWRLYETGETVAQSEEPPF